MTVLLCVCLRVPASTDGVLRCNHYIPAHGECVFGTLSCCFFSANGAVSLISLCFAQPQDEFRKDFNPRRGGFNAIVASQIGDGEAPPADDAAPVGFSFGDMDRDRDRRRPDSRDDRDRGWARRGDGGRDRRDDSRGPAPRWERGGGGGDRSDRRRSRSRSPDYKRRRSSSRERY